MERMRAVLGLGSWRLGSLPGGKQFHPPLMKVLANLIIRGAEPSCPREASKAPHRIIALFDRSMVLFDAIVEVSVGTVDDGEAQDGLDGLWIGRVLVGRDAVGLMANRGDGLLEK